jgi:hypothetical protein
MVVEINETIVLENIRTFSIKGTVSCYRTGIYRKGRLDG